MKCRSIIEKLQARSRLYHILHHLSLDLFGTNRCNCDHTSPEYEMSKTLRDAEGTKTPSLYPSVNREKGRLNRLVSGQSSFSPCLYPIFSFWRVKICFRFTAPDGHLVKDSVLARSAEHGPHPGLDRGGNPNSFGE